MRDGLTVFNKKRRVRLKEKNISCIEKIFRLIGFISTDLFDKRRFKNITTSEGQCCKSFFHIQSEPITFSVPGESRGQQLTHSYFPSRADKKKNKRQWSPPAQLKESQSFSRCSNRVRPAILSLAWLHYVRSPGRHKGS